MKKKLSERTIHITGSCSPIADVDIINHSHIVVKNLTKYLLEHGASIVTSVGKNPKVNNKEKTSPSIIFDWDVLDVVYNYAKNLSYSNETKDIVKVIATSKTLQQIPEEKKKMWTELIKNGVLSIIRISYGWNSGAVRRQKIESLSDILIAIGGGEGVEHLAELFSINGKTIIPINIPVGSSCQDGKGGAIYLSQQFLSKPRKFIPKINNMMISRYSLLDYKNWKENPKEYAKTIFNYITELVGPQVFFVRLLNKKYKESPSVDKFFKEIIIPYITDKSLSFKDMEFSENEEGFLNVEIFKEINNSSIVIVDLTSLRPNCFTEMGFSFGLKKKVIVTAMEGTDLPFDSTCIPCFFWDFKKPLKTIKKEFNDFWIQNINRGPLIKPPDII